MWLDAAVYSREFHANVRYHVEIGNAGSTTCFICHIQLGFAGSRNVRIRLYLFVPLLILYLINDTVRRVIGRDLSLFKVRNYRYDITRYGMTITVTQTDKERLNQILCVCVCMFIANNIYNLY